MAAPQEAIPGLPSFADVRRPPRPAAAGWPLFRVSADPGMSPREFADARTIIQYNARPLGRDLRALQAGDLLYFTDAERRTDHLMVFIGRSRFEPAGNDWVVYHTGPDGATDGEVRKVTLARAGGAPDCAMASNDRQPVFRGRVQVVRARLRVLMRYRSTAGDAGASSSSRSSRSRRSSRCRIARARRRPNRAPATPAFSVASSQIFTSKERAAVYLTFRRVDHLDFRVYRVNDSLQFFAKLRDPHQLGSEEPVVPQERTLIERIAIWKAAWRDDIRYFLRGQFSHEYRAARREQAEKQQIQLRRTVSLNTFAQVPLLNPSQLVTSWREILPPVRDAESRRIPLDLPGRGHLRGRSRQPAAARLHRRHRVRRRPGDEDGARPAPAVRRQPLHGRVRRPAATPRSSPRIASSRGAAPMADGLFDAVLVTGKEETGDRRRALRRRDGGHRSRRLRAARAGARSARLHLHRQAGVPPGTHGPLQGGAPLARARRARAVRAQAGGARRRGHERQSAVPDDEAGR